MNTAEMIALVDEMANNTNTEEKAPESGEHMVTETHTEEVVAEVAQEAPPAEIVPAAAPVVDSSKEIFPEYVLKGSIQAVKLPHRNLVLEGVADRCAHCSLALTDSISITRGIGPICSKKAYSEEPVDGDEMQAMIDLAKWPEVVEFLTEHYKPLGMRGLVNGLVRLAALNRPRGTGKSEGNLALHQDICSSLDSLGYRKVASLLRETLATVFVRPNAETGMVSVKVRKAEWTSQYSYDMRTIPGVGYDKVNRAYLVPVHLAGDATRPIINTGADGNPVSNKRRLWDILIRHYEGQVVKTETGSFKIAPRKEKVPS